MTEIPDPISIGNPPSRFSRAPKNTASPGYPRRRGGGEDAPSCGRVMNLHQQPAALFSLFRTPAHSTGVQTPHPHATPPMGPHAHHSESLRSALSGDAANRLTSLHLLRRPPTKVLSLGPLRSLSLNQPFFRKIYSGSHARGFRAKAPKHAVFQRKTACFLRHPAAPAPAVRHSGSGRPPRPERNRGAERQRPAPLGGEDIHTTDQPIRITPTRPDPVRRASHGTADRSAFRVPQRSGARVVGDAARTPAHPAAPAVSALHP